MQKKEALFFNNASFFAEKEGLVPAKFVGFIDNTFVDEYAYLTDEMFRFDDF